MEEINTNNIIYIYISLAHILSIFFDLTHFVIVSHFSSRLLVYFYLARWFFLKLFLLVLLFLCFFFFGFECILILTVVLKDCIGKLYYNVIYFDIYLLFFCILEILLVVEKNSEHLLCYVLFFFILVLFFVLVFLLGFYVFVLLFCLFYFFFALCGNMICCSTMFLCTFV